MRHEIRDLIHQVDAQIVVVDAHVYVHSANHHPARRGLHLAGESVELLLLRVQLPRGTRERMRRGCYGGQPVILGKIDDHAAQPREIGSHFGNRVANASAHFELRTQEFRADLAVAAVCTFAQQLVRRVLVHVA